MIRNRRITVILLCAIAVGIAAGCAMRESRRPNVVVILIDTLRADHLPFYGYTHNTAPFLSQLAADGVVFDNAWSSSSWTAPATASLFTSLYPFQHGVVTGLMYTQALQKKDPRITVNRIAEEVTTMPEVLKEAGYTTFGVADNPNISEVEGFDQGFDYFKNENYMGADSVNAGVLQWESYIDASEPYFLYLHYMDPHSPYHARDERAKNVTAAQGQERIFALYDSEIRFVDAHIEALFNRFSWNKNTVVIVLADHGEEFGERGGSGHGKNLFAETMRIPLVVYDPGGGLKPGRVKHNASIVDVVPTIRAFLGLGSGASDEGVDLMKVRAGKSNLVERSIYAHLWRRWGTVDPADDLVSGAVVKNEWKYVFTMPDEEKLFDIIADPREQHNALTGRQLLADEMRADYDGFVESSRKYKSAESSVAADEETLKKLKSLGYVR